MMSNSLNTKVFLVDDKTILTKLGSFQRSTAVQFICDADYCGSPLLGASDLGTNTLG
jgi:hypothetical protein